jgi:hypothetical protein
MSSPRSAVPVLLAALLGSAVAFAAVVGLGASPLTRVDFPLDDAWIHLDYAVGILRDGMPSYNPGAPEAGFSSPLWLAAITPAALLARVTGAPVALLVKALSVALGGGASFVLARSALRWGASTPVAAAVALLAPLGPWWCAGAASGMEVSLTALMLALTLDAMLDGRRAAGPYLALALLSRPECAVCVPALALVAGRGLPPRAALRRGAALALPAALAALAWAAWCLAVAGRPLPNTFYAKVTGVDLPRSLAFAARALSEDGAVLAVLLPALAAAGLRGAARRSPSAAWSWASLAALPALAVLLSRALDPAVLLYLRRYLYPFLMLLWWPAALGLQQLVDLARARTSLPPRALAALGAAVGLTVAAGCALSARAAHADQCRDIATFHTAPARYIAEHAPRGAVVAVEGAGSARFFGGHVVVDLIGLNEHALLRHPRGSDAYHCAVLTTFRPTWFVVPSPWLQYFAPWWEFTVEGSYRSAHYAQLEPPRTHEVVILRATPRPESAARCRALASAQR